MTALAERTAPAIPPAGNRDLVLVVDDSPIDARLAARAVELALGVRTRQVADGVAALEAIARERPALVVTDLGMPEMDGLELVRAVADRYPHLPVILMTSQGSEAVALEAMRAGAANYVPKQVMREQLPAAAQSVLTVSRTDRHRQRFLEGIEHLDCTVRLENDPALLPVFIAHVQEQLERIGLCDAKRRLLVGVALEEALLNGMYHGNLELGSKLREDGAGALERIAALRRLQPPYASRRLHVRYMLTPDMARFAIRDEGPGFDVRSVPDPSNPENMIKPIGRGLMLIRTFVDDVSHNATGNEIVLRISRKPG